MACRRVVPPESEFQACPSCGDRLARRGYCTVCEAPWSLEPGTPCPKHDLDLLDEEPRVRPSLHHAEPENWTTVARFADSLRAQAPRIRLEAEGIPTFVEGERMGSPTMYHIATGGVKLKVPADLAAEARIILSQTWSSTVAELDLEDEVSFDEPEEDWLERDPPSRQAPRVGPPIRLLAGLVIVKLLIILFSLAVAG